jgi:probable addiction module antidote protein
LEISAIARVLAEAYTSCGWPSVPAIEFISERRTVMSSYSGVARNSIRRKTSRVGESTGRNTKAGAACKSIPWEPYLINSLKNPKEAEGYLNAALEDDDPRIFLLALRDVAEAHGGMSKIARTCKLNRESLYRMLSKKGNPSLESLSKLLSGMGFRLAVEKKDAA